MKFINQPFIVLAALSGVVSASLVPTRQRIGTITYCNQPDYEGDCTTEEITGVLQLVNLVGPLASAITHFEDPRGVCNFCGATDNCRAFLGFVDNDGVPSITGNMRYARSFFCAFRVGETDSGHCQGEDQKKFGIPMF